MEFGKPMSLEEVFEDFKGRRIGLIKALTSDVAEFFKQCDPERENLCLFGLPNGSWEVTMPAPEAPSDIPEPVAGINFPRDSMEKKNWLSLIAAHSDSWLVARAFFSACRLNKSQRSQLFEMINDLPTVHEVVDGKLKAKEDQSSNDKSKKRPRDKMQSSQKKMTVPVEETETAGEVEEDESNLSICDVCGKTDGSEDEFWICCNICDVWVHGRCVKITTAMAEHMSHYKCPACSEWFEQ